jgi:hypothetical protein
MLHLLIGLLRARFILRDNGRGSKWESVQDAYKDEGAWLITTRLRSKILASCVVSRRDAA